MAFKNLEEKILQKNDRTEDAPATVSLIKVNLFMPNMIFVAAFF
jgi:hypothetical protein